MESCAAASWFMNLCNESAAFCCSLDKNVFWISPEGEIYQ